MNNSIIIWGVGVIVSSIGIIFAIYSFFAILSDMKKQKRIVEGLEYRRIYGLFDVSKYINSQEAIKRISFLWQKNDGLDPKIFNRRLSFINYLEEDSQLIIKKRG